MLASTRVVLLVLCGLFWASACSQGDQQRPASGGLVVAIDTDLSLPKDLDALRVEVAQGATVLFEDGQKLGEDARALPFEVEVSEAQGGTRLLVHAFGLKDGETKIERSALITVPTGYVGFVRLTLDYLCEGMVSSCGAEETCIQGSCESAAIAGALPDIAMRSQAQRGCFDIAECFSMATELTPDAADSCSFTAADAQAGLNVALRLDAGSEGFCTQTGCWVVLDALRVEGDRVFLPQSVCARRGLRVAVSAQCPAKLPTMRICPASDAPARRPVSVGVSRSMVGDACTGGATHACERCGTQTRTCKNGLWSEFGACSSQGECEPEATERCGASGVRTCGGDCSWGECESQSCAGPGTRSCGHCGTQHRSCSNGAWSEWSACSDEGVCAPGSTQACGSGGTQACQGSCEWSACAMQVCSGAAVDGCGNCGTRTRSCNAGTAEWSAWSECQEEGECRPDATRSCGRDGTQTCGGSCRWEDACASQTCEGAARRACGSCGSQTRTCDRTTGEYSEWSACSDEGECRPDERRVCGAGGEQTCGGNCRWGSECTGQGCSGASMQDCGDCGRQARSCDTNTGQWSDWGACSDEGECTPGEIGECGSGGQRTCGSACRWSSECGGQDCVGSDTQRCGNCGTQSRSCDMRTGEWSAWGSCSDEGECTPGEIGECGSGGQRACGSACRWSSECVGQGCNGSGMQRCGACGTQSRTCDTRTGEWSAWGSCSDEGECTPGEIGECGSGGQRSCGEDCRWGSECSGQGCVGENVRGCGDCGTQGRGCDMTTGEWGEWGPCVRQGPCSPGETRACEFGGFQTCPDTCRWLPDDCPPPTCTGPSEQTCPNNPCVRQTRTCDESRGVWSDWSPSCPSDGCQPGDTDADGCMEHAARTCDESTCTWSAACECIRPYWWCPDNSCQRFDNDPENCGRCGRRCAEGQACENGGCQCAANELRCDTRCCSSDQVCESGMCQTPSAPARDGGT